VYHAPRLKLAVFDYQPSRSTKGVQQFLDYFQGYLQTDGYAAYDKLVDQQDDITLLACMAHSRRYFEKALDNDRVRASYALQVIQSLHRVERTAKENPSINLLEAREQQATPILEEWKTWLEEQRLKVLPKSNIGKTVNYTLNLWGRLTRYTQQDRFHIYKTT